MKKLIIPLALGFVCTSFTVIPTTAGSPTAAVVPVRREVIHPDNSIATSIYCGANLEEHGLSREAFDYAWKGYEYLLAHNKISRQVYLTICDFSQRSSQKRMYIIDVEKGQLVKNTWVAHGKNSGSDFATKFSNTPESLQSSLGFYVTGDTYIGEHGLSLRVHGMEPGFNDKAYERSIVVHGAAYVDGARARAGVFMGRSFGCPAVPQNESNSIINLIKKGTCVFIYHPSKNYLQHSKILND